MATLNKVQLIGYLGKDPELRYTPNGKEVCDISVATTSSWNGSDGQKKEHTEWTTVTCWGQLAVNVSQYLQKGSMVYVEGRKQTVSSEKAKTGNTIRGRGQSGNVPRPAEWQFSRGVGIDRRTR